jgi:hypothetical protein
LLLFIFNTAFAQDKKYVYRDSSLIQDEQEVAPPVEDESIEIVPMEDHTAEKKYIDGTPDTVLYKNRLKLPADSILQWKNAKDFQYAKNLDSLLKEKKNTEKKKADVDQGPGFLDRFFSSSFLKIILWLLAICFILFILYRLFLTQGVFRRETRTKKPDMPEVEEEIISGETDFDAMIRQAIQQNNYRQAVRYQYLKTLHKLAGKNFIELAPDKTNYQYVREIKNVDLQSGFAGLTLNYEYVWYGEFEIDRNIYQKLEPGFTGLNQKV